MKKFFIFALATVLFTLVSALNLFAGVNLKNGNFYISYTDIVVPGAGEKLSITRTYNSKATKIGWFGYGWGSDFETYLSAEADGSVIIHENGTGAETRFLPPNGVVNVDAAVDKIMKAAQEKSAMTADAVAKLKLKLKSDLDMRKAYAEKFNVRATLAKGTVLMSNDRGLQEVVKTDTGYMRKYNDGKTERYNENGKLVEVKEKNGYTVSFNYENNILKSIKDSAAKQLFFTWYPDGKAQTIATGDGTSATYKYNSEDLAESKDVGGNLYKYSYDSNHNLTSIGYSDNTKMVVKYESKTQFTSAVTERDGAETKYEYGANPQNPDLHYWTIVTKKGFNEQPIRNRYEYEIKKLADGAQYTYRIYTDINGVTTETLYDEKSKLPSKITRGKVVTNFKYNDKGLLVEKTSTTGEKVQIEYNKDINKISRVVNNSGWTNFKYDGKGNLKQANNSTGQSVLLIYDRDDRITKMVDEDTKTKAKRMLSFKYNAMGKPVEIVLDNVGKINVDYDNYGEIKKVESKEGHKMALQVTQAFQNLLAIVKPAGVNLNL